MSTIVRAGSSAEFLALVPHLLECTPHRSLALVAFADGRSIGALRVDLPDPAVGADVDVDSVASTVIGMACKISRADAIAAVVYSDRRLTDAEDLPHRQLVDAVRSRADICGLRVTDALVVGADGWDSYLTPAENGPLPLADIEARDDLPAVDGDQLSAVALPEIARASVETVARLLTDVEHLLSRSRAAKRLSGRHRSDAAKLIDVLGDPPAVFEAAVASDSPLDVQQLAAMSFCLQRPALRDVALMQWVGDLATGDATYRAQFAFAEGRAFPADLARPMCGEGARPEPTRLLRALEACRQVAAASPRAERPGPLAACAWLAWAGGRSTHAGAYADQALAIDAEHGLAGIVRTLVGHGRLPEWVFERPAATSPAGTGSSHGSRAR
ncbi:DUF4192 family protein [Microbacterium sp. SLBN-111]|uniref:DUF4192 family protein n=1 Tax=Microbacterium sp. SLBN-111 TaxID=3377733 RepID=UPI003C734C59